jgi:DNA-nicking Smr family endonuclease
MDFGSILDKWEKRNTDGGTIAAEAVGRAASMNLPIRARGAYDGEPGAAANRAGAQEKRRRLRNKKPDAELDIHGKTRDEAWQALEAFFDDSRSSGMEKIMVIHGKGNHSTSDAVLKRVVMDFIERCPFAGESGRGKTSAGGEGVTWVLLRETTGLRAQVNVLGK